jgi:mono/diheme cytochrome c family protein
MFANTKNFSMGEQRMKSDRIALVILAVTLFVITTACNNSSTVTTNSNGPSVAASPGSTTAPDEFASARTTFDKHCSACHGSDGAGGPVTVDDVKLKIPSLREGHPVTHTDDKLVRQITNGDEPMPAFKDKLSSQEIIDLVRFIRKEFQRK